MTLETLRRRAERKRATVTAKRGVYTVTDSKTGVMVGTVSDLLALEDLINWLDTP
jgi:hypothetical protein